MAANKRHRFSILSNETEITTPSTKIQTPTQAEFYLGVSAFLDAWSSRPPSHAARSSALAVRIATILKLAERERDDLHLSCLGARCPKGYCTAKIETKNVLNLKQAEQAASMCCLTRFQKNNNQLQNIKDLAEQLDLSITIHGLLAGFERVTKRGFPEDLLDAAWDVRYDEIFWSKLHKAPLQASADAAGPAGRAPIDPDRLQAVIGCLGPVVASRDDSPAPSELTMLIRTLFQDWLHEGVEREAA